MSHDAGFHSNWFDVFVQEADELLSAIEESALALSEGATEDTVHRLFRAFHTIKGSSGMCGLTGVAAFTHHVETLLDKVRSGAVAATPELADVVLAARDQIRLMIAAEAAGEHIEEGSSAKLIEQLESLSLCGHNGPSDAPSKPDSQSSDVAAAVPAEWRISFRPARDLFASGGNPVLVMRELASLGDCELTAYTDQIPPLDQLDSTQCYLSWTAVLRTKADANAIRDVFMFVEDGADLVLEQSVSQHGASSHITSAAEETSIQPLPTTKADAESAARTVAPVKALAKESTVRVPADRLDRLVNLVGELVMTQSRITETAVRSGAAELANPVQELERLVSELRDDVLGIRMLPIGTLFSRFRRLVHDLSRELGKDVELITEGAETELDKSILDQLSEPLVHVLRNSIDHGLEGSEQRAEQGKPLQGAIRLTAKHAGANVVIEVQDDGRGIDLEAVRSKAIEKQLIPPDAVLTEEELLKLLLLPGFSTAKQVTNISGRGVGMDVVKRQIELLRGTLQITSTRHVGTTISLKLPLTLAIIEGLLVQIENTRFILPMSAVTENVELQSEERSRRNGRNTLCVRGELIPYIDVRALFDMRGRAPAVEKVVILEYDQKRVGFVVDRVLGTHQTVLQPLGKLFHNVQVASGATIMGDGEVALILDIAAVIRLANQKAQAPLTRVAVPSGSALEQGTLNA